jgi:hypothetical protein
LSSSKTARTNVRSSGAVIASRALPRCVSVDRIRDGPEPRRTIYSVLCDVSRRRASCTSVLGIGS